MATDNPASFSERTGWPTGFRGGGVEPEPNIGSTFNGLACCPRFSYPVWLAELTELFGVGVN